MLVQLTEKEKIVTSILIIQADFFGVFSIVFGVERLKETEKD